MAKATIKARYTYNRNHLRKIQLTFELKKDVITYSFEKYQDIFHLMKCQLNNFKRPFLIAIIHHLLLTRLHKFDTDCGGITRGRNLNRTFLAC